jgi:16S rRNA (cytosine967-C5)-methyltransferase
MKKKPTSAPIPSARAQALALLGVVLGESRTLDEALAYAPPAGTDADRRFTVMLVLMALRHRGQLDTLLANYLESPLPPRRAAAMNGLRIGVVQLLLLDTPAHAAVNETVAAVKNSKDAGLAGLVNAVLQKIGRERPALPEPIHNLPVWLRTRWEAAYGSGAVAAMAAVAATRAPLDLNMVGDMADATRIDTQILRLGGDHPPVEALPGYEAGEFFVQDVAASYPVRLLGDVRQHQVLDVCAAPGGKAAQLVRAGAFVTAIDRAPARMRVLKVNMKRLNAQVNAVTGDVMAWEPSRPYDAVLLDAPCSATGTWRRHPEVVHGLKPDDIMELVGIQRAMLARAWGWVKPGGKLVYCVCSLEPEEGEAQAEWFLSTQADAALAPIPANSEVPAECVRGGMLRTLPSHKAEQGGMDGFFAVCFVKA